MLGKTNEKLTRRSDEYKKVLGKGVENLVKDGATHFVAIKICISRDIPR